MAIFDSKVHTKRTSEGQNYKVIKKILEWMFIYYRNKVQMKRQRIKHISKNLLYDGGLKSSK